MSKRFLYDPITGSKTEIEDVTSEISIKELKEQKHIELEKTYTQLVSSGFVSSINGQDITYGYRQEDQLNYSKLANLFALNPDKVSTYLGTVSHGVISLTREQFISLMDDAEQHEMGLFMKKKSIENLITLAESVKEVEKIETHLS